MRRLNVILVVLFSLTVNCKKKCPNCEIVPTAVKQTVFVFQDKKYVADTYVNNYVPDANTNYGNASNILAEAWTNTGIDIETYLLLRFDYSSLPGNAVIKSATLTLYADTTDAIPLNPGHFGNGADSAIIRNVTNWWNEGTVTWNSFPSFTSVHEVKIQPTRNTSDSVFVDVTYLIQDQIRNGNYGFKVDLLDYTPFRRLFFYSSDESMHKKLMPKLIIYIQ